MKKLALLVFVLTSFTSAFAMDEKSSTSCDKMNQDSAYQEKVATAAPKAPVVESKDKGIVK